MSRLLLGSMAESVHWRGISLMDNVLDFIDISMYFKFHFGVSVANKSLDYPD